MDMRECEVIAPNFKKRLSGVTSTIIQLVPVQSRALGIAVLGPGLPASLPRLRLSQLPGLWRAPRGRMVRVWHARRNVEMLPGIVMRDLLRMPLKLVFTSASQRRHTAYTKWLIGRMDAVVATSARTGSYLDGAHEVILHGIDTQRFHPAPDKAAAKAALGLPAEQKIVGCFGRVRRQKGTDLFVDAMIALLPARPGWTAIVAGRATGPHESFEAGLRRRVAEAGLAERILFVGEHTNIPPWYRALDLFVAPQRWEGFGLTPLEAMASGVPVVAADVGAFSEIIVTGSGETGIIVPAGQADAMARAAGALMDEDGRRIAAGANARAHVAARFSIENEARALEAVYRRLMGGSPASGRTPSSSATRL
ncbi:glycosyltransferase family 4 protein [Aureimonas populi]|uniref:Glycosyltransferase family 4 protein n=1 Tax=Aureimonas populi TaxID=1701758 RepID=A0ABW5CHP3_9HYPH|nr:glycosyltransferase family 4 protein [Aureimonas populi]